MTDLDRELEAMAEAIEEARRASTGRAARPPAGRARRAGRLVGWALAFGVGVGSGVWVAARGLEPPLAGPHDTRVEGKLVRGSLRHDERAGEVRFSMLVDGVELPVRYAIPFVPDFLEVAFDMLEEQPDVSGLGQAMVVGEALPGGDFAARHVRAGPGCTLGYWEGSAERRVRRMQRVSRDAASTGEVVLDVGAELERAPGRVGAAACIVFSLRPAAAGLAQNASPAALPKRPGARSKGGLSGARSVSAFSPTWPR